MSKLTEVISAAFPWQVRALAKTVRAASQSHLMTAFTTIAISEDYHVTRHKDAEDLPFSSIMWFLPDPAVPPKSTFRMPSLKAWLTPRHGSLLVLNSRDIVHGTYLSEVEEELEANKTGILGVAMFSRKDVVTAYGNTVAAAMAAAVECLKEELVSKLQLTAGDVEGVTEAVCTHKRKAEHSKPVQGKAVQGKRAK